MVQGGFNISGLGEKDRRWFKEGLILQGWERRIEDGSRRVLFCRVGREAILIGRSKI